MTNGDINVVAAEGAATSYEDIEIGEVFSVGDTTYTGASLGLLTDTDSDTYKLLVDYTEKNIDKDFMPIGTVTADDLGKTRLITADTENRWNIHVDDDTIDGVTFVDAIDSTAALEFATYDKEAGTLTAKEYGFAVSTIEVDGVDLTVDADFSDSAVTAAASSGTAQFITTELDGATFSVKAAGDYANVDGAPSIVLIDGTIVADNNEEVMLVVGDVTSNTTKSDPVQVNINGDTPIPRLFPAPRLL